MPACVEVAFRLAGKLHLYDPAGLALKPGDWVVVEVDKGEGLGRVLRVLEAEVQKGTAPLRKVIRKATLEDLNRQERLRSQEAECFRICRDMIAARRLPMRLVCSEYSFDGRKITFFFTAEGRVDFRALVRDLASRFRRRIEMRQIGVRDETKLLGGIGPCGRMLCCCTFMREFEPISIRMAKKQSVSLNPNKISGLCGKLMCCLAYEVAVYDGSSPQGQGRNAADSSALAAKAAPSPESPKRGQRFQQHRNRPAGKALESKSATGP